VPAPIVVINPNSTEEVTRGIGAALEGLRFPGGPAIECLTLREGPPGIESQAQSDAVVAPLLALIASRETDAGAFVIACFSDPGLHAARERCRRPVFGIAESAMATALTRGERFGIVSILEASLPRHARAVRAAGLSERFAGDVAIGLGVTPLSSEQETYGRLLAAGETLRDARGADVLILGCAGMARYRARLEAAIGRPVIDPCQAAAALAVGLLAS